jgi:hypothetical protein
MAEQGPKKPRLRRWIPITGASLVKLGRVGGGSSHKLRRMVLYSVAELDRWAAEQLSSRDGIPRIPVARPDQR